MASWCWICHYKVDATYRWFNGGKVHKKCIKKYKEKEVRTSAESDKTGAMNDKEKHNSR